MSGGESGEGRSNCHKGQLSPQKLFDQGDYQRAAELLVECIDQNPTDADRRLLAECLLSLDDETRIPEALRHSQEIEDKRVHDLLRIGWCCLQLQEWDDAIHALEQSTGLEERAIAYHWLAAAHARGRETYQLDEEAQQLIRGNLRAAMSLPGCRVSAFLWLEDLQDWSEEGLDERVAILEAAQEQHPDSEEVSCRLAERFAFRLGNPGRALAVLAPQLSQGKPGLYVLWLAFEARCSMGEYSAALENLDELMSREKDLESLLSLLAVRSITSQKMGDHTEALLGFEQVLERDPQDFDLCALSILGLAAAYMATQRVEDATHCMNTAVELCWQEACKEWSDADTFGSYHISLWLDGRMAGYEGASYVLQICQDIIATGSGFLSEESQGWLFYIRYCIQRFSSKEAAYSSLLTASDMLDHPVVSGALVDYFLYEAEDVVSAVEHHLRYAFWKHSVWAQEKEFSRWRGEFECRDEEGNALQVSEVWVLNRIHQVAMAFLRDCEDPSAVSDVLEPFYSSFWRTLLVDNQMFEHLVEANALFLNILGESDRHLWDHALGLQEIDRIEEAEAEYREYMGRHPDNPSTLHNLSIILEEKGLEEEAFELSSKATALVPDSELYAKRWRRVKVKLDQRKRIQDMISGSSLGAERQRELDEFYWHTDISTAELQGYYGLAKAAHHYATPLLTEALCPNCGWRLVYRTRTARNREDRCCQNCDHIGRRSCRCAYCTRIREEDERRRKEERLRQERAAYQKRLNETSSEDYIGWALSQLTRREKIFIRSFLEVVAESETPTWEEIADRAKVVSHKRYMKKLLDLHLLLKPPEGGISANPGLQLEMIRIPEQVRKISKSDRFDVFQRDSHTCQYCGRKSPDVELQVDHLVPVARGGTDDFENLVTSCADCNSGKSAKLIKEFTGGHNIEEWREKLREKRTEALRERRTRLPEVMEHWAECRGARTVSEYDADFIHNFIERYDPDWIKEAIRIATGKRLNNYAKYVAGILRNWAKTGPPEYMRDPDGYLDRKKATPKQIEYVKGLLNSLGLELGGFYHKTDFDELTMLDARNLIEALKARSTGDNGG